jgi:undecaprenyl-phosphate galactose phosphotransferase
VGDMSIVGPRPIIQDEVIKYDEDIYYYNLVKPGITGLWQISGRNDIDYKSRVRLDVWYVKNWSIWHDLVIIIRTFKVVLAKNGAY